jgi:hypothetical protein
VTKLFQHKDVSCRVHVHDTAPKADEAERAQTDGIPRY